jgi:hypothetical protein
MGLRRALASRGGAGGRRVGCSQAIEGGSVGAYRIGRGRVSQPSGLARPPFRRRSRSARYTTHCTKGRGVCAVRDRERPPAAPGGAAGRRRFDGNARSRRPAGREVNALEGVGLARSAARHHAPPAVTRGDPRGSALLLFADRGTLGPPCLCRITLCCGQCRVKVSPT